MRGGTGILMKLLIAIVQDEDSSKLVSKMMQQGFGVTKLATTGGFLKAGNTTLLLGVDDSRVEEAIEVTDFHAKIDYAKCVGCGTCIDKCKKGSIVEH